MMVLDKSSREEDVRERLLKQAEILFCKNGFSGTSIRDITSEAKCNVAAVNYHFSGKEGLYQEVFQRHMRNLREVRLAGIEKVMSENGVTLERLLYAFAMVFIEPLLDKSCGRPFMELMMREILDPHLPKKMFADEVAIPTVNALGKAIAVVCRGLDRKKTVMSVISVISQLMHAIHLNTLFRDEWDLESPVPDISEMVEHIVKFSAAGIRASVKEIR